MLGWSRDVPSGREGGADLPLIGWRNNQLITPYNGPHTGHTSNDRPGWEQRLRDTASSCCCVVEDRILCPRGEFEIQPSGIAQFLSD
jgi:hypothetical protein